MSWWGITGTAVFSNSVGPAATSCFLFEINTLLPAPLAGQVRVVPESVLEAQLEHTPSACPVIWKLLTPCIMSHSMENAPGHHITCQDGNVWKDKEGRIVQCLTTALTNISVGPKTSWESRWLQPTTYKVQPQDHEAPWYHDSLHCSSFSPKWWVWGLVDCLLQCFYRTASTKFFSSATWHG